MKCTTILMVGLVTAGLTGCVNYAKIERTRIGMTVDELMALETPCYYGGQTDDQITYHCRFSIPSGPQSEKRTIKPYIMKFENNTLTEITLDENELTRQEIRDNYYFQHRFYYPYGHFRAGYPYYP